MWVPFGQQQVQGVVVSLADHAPVPTKPVARLARPEPVLTHAQIQLAFWIAEYYVAPLSETIKLFIPPGLLHKDAATHGVRAKRELEIELVADAEAIAAGLLTVGRNSQQASLLAALLETPIVSTTALKKRCGSQER